MPNSFFDTVLDGARTLALPSGLEIFLDLDAREWVDASDVGDTDARRLLRLPVWQSAWKAKHGGFAEVPPGTDFPRTGRLRAAKGELKGYGTPAKPWKVAIDHGFFRNYLRFDFYDLSRKARISVPRCLVVSGLGKAQVAGFMGELGRVAAGTVLDDQGTVYLLHERTKKSSGDIEYYFATGERGGVARGLIDLGAASGDRRAISAEPTGSESPLSSYQLPVEWCSHGMEAYEGAAGATAPKRVPFAQARLKGASPATPLVFHLDDAALGRGPQDPVQLPADARVCLFDNLLHIRDPDPKRPHLWKTTLHANYLRAEEAIYVDGGSIEQFTRVIYFDGDVFDINDKRVAVADAAAIGKTRCLGARVAMPIADARHQIANYTDGNPAMPQEAGFARGSGRSVFHLLDSSFVPHTVTTTSGSAAMRLLHLLVVVPLHVDHSKVNAEAAAEFYSLLAMAGERWDQLHPGHPGLPASGEKPSELVLLPANGATAGALVVRVRHYFGVARVDFPNVMEVILRRPSGDPERDRGDTDVVNRVMNIFVDDIGPRDDGTGEEYQMARSRFTLAHELGHVMGHSDEYFEELPVGAVETWNQYSIDGAPARPFYNDAVSVLQSNNKPRLRHYWNYASRVNLESNLRDMTSGETFYPTNISFPGGPLRYELADVGPLPGGRFSTQADKNPYYPLLEDIDWGNARRAKASLYRLGDDEGSVVRMFRSAGGMGTPLAPDQRINGLFLMRIRFMLRSGPGVTAASDRARHLQKIERVFANKEINNFSAYRFYRNAFLLECEPKATSVVGSPYLHRIAAAFTPQFDYSSRHPASAVPTGDININVVASRAGPHPLTLDVTPLWLDLLETELDLSLARFALGLATFVEDPQSHARVLVTSLEPADFQPFADILASYLATPPPYRRAVSRLP